MSLFSSTDNSLKPTCTYCQEDINGPGVQCAECDDFDICLQCFSSGAEIGPHKNNHAYKLITHKNDAPKEETTNNIFGGKSNWTGREHLQLLDAMDQCSFGSWDYVAAELIDTKLAEELKEEYISRYLNGTIGQVTWNEIGDVRPVLPEHAPLDKGPLAPEVKARLPPIDVTPEEARELGYMPHRDDFIREYDTQAEELVSSLQLNLNEERKEEISLKLAIVDMYTRRLRERCRRKRVVRDYQLIAKFYANKRKDAQKKVYTKEQKDFRENMKIFSQFLTSGEHERLIESIERERELRHRINELLKYRGMGLMTQEEIVHYEQHVAFQTQQQLRQNQAGSSGYRTTTQELRAENGERGGNQSFTGGKSMDHHDDYFTRISPLNDGINNSNSPKIYEVNGHKH